MNYKHLYVFATILLLTSVAFADYLDAFAKGVTQAGSSVYVRGYVRNSTSGIAGVNVTANLSGASNSSVSSSSGYFDINITTPSSSGEYNISVSTNTSLSKSIRVFVSNTSSGYINFTGSKPPFSAGISFMINVSIKNASGGMIANYTPTVKIYTANGPTASWAVANTTPANNHTGYVGYNITVSSDADGTYTISVDGGMISTVILIRSTYIMAVNTQTSNNETKTDFSPGANFTIVAKIRDTSGNPIGYAVNVSARVTKPNGAIDTVTLSNDTTREGHYVSSAYITDGSLRGQYKIDVSAIVSGKRIESSAIVNTEAIKARLDKQAEFFKEWGDSAAFTAGGTIGLNVIVTNLSDDSVFTGTMTQLGSYANCTSGGTNITGLYASNGTAVSIGTVTYDAGGTYMGTTVCRVTFTAPSITGNYKVTFNTSVGNLNVSGTGYFEVQKYMLKPSPVSSLGGAFDFMVMLQPGENATFQISAFDLNTQIEVAGINITNLTVTKIIPLDFTGGGSDILEGSLGKSDAFNITNYTIGSNTVNPTITVQLPVNRTGPFQAEVSAVIRGATTNESVTGRGFYLAKYIMGFLSSFGNMMGGPPGSGSEGGGPMESGPSGGFGGSSACSSTENFKGNVVEIKTNSAPKDPVTFNNIMEAREEMTGKSVLSCLSMTLNSSDSSGNVQVPVLFNTSVSGCSSLSGFYFMLINVTYQGKQDAIPAGFNCKRLSFWPSVTDSSGTFSWKIAPRGSVTLQVSNVQRINDSTTIRNGTVQIVRAFNFNPGSGMRMLAPNGTLAARINISSASANITLVPSNFSLSTWPSGFIAITVQVTAGANYSNIADTSESGFQVTPFDVNAMQLNGQYNIWGQTLSAGQNISIAIEVSANVSRNNNDYTVALGANTTTGFTAKVGIPWEGKMKDVSIYRTNLTSDGWNNTNNSVWPNFGRERWLINIILPANLKKGFNMIEITVNNSANEKATTEIGFQAASYSVKLGQEEGLMTQSILLPWVSPDDMTTLTNLGLNINAIKNTHGYNSSSGVICAGRGLNMTNWNEGGQNTNRWYGSNVTFIVLDNGTANVYDTIIINKTGGPLLIVRERQNITIGNHSSPLYLWKIDGCGYSKWINASAISSQGWSWGGSWQKGGNFSLPYIVQKSSAAVSGATVSVNAIIKQMDSTGSGQGGFGFDRKLTASDYTSLPATTDANGIAFVNLNISGASGSMMVFWKINDNGIEDIASFKTMGPGGDSGTQVQIRNFETWGQRVARVRGSHAAAVVTLYNYTNTSNPANVWGYTVGTAGSIIYNGTYNETVSGALVNDNNNKTYYVLFNSTSAVDLFMIDSDTDFTGVQPSNKNNSFSIDGASIAIGEIRQTGNISITNITTLALYRDTSEWYPVTSASQNITVSVCAQSFAKPAVSYPGASVYIYAESWSMGSPTSTSTALKWNDPINGTQYTFGANNATTGPKGCAVIDVSHPTGWPANSPVNIKATVTYSGNSESTWVDNVWRPSQCSNMIDDDGDGTTDYRNWWGSPDSACSSSMDDNESA